MTEAQKISVVYLFGVSIEALKELIKDDPAASKDYWIKTLHPGILAAFKEGNVTLA